MGSVSRIGLVLSLVLGFAGALRAAPVDARPGDVRAVYLQEGTPLRAEPRGLAAAVATLPSGTQVVVQEVRLPWLRVTRAGASGPSGWLRALETVEPSALAPNPRPSVTAPGGAGGASSRDISAAGRQLDATTERGYRTSKPELARAYAAVDAMEAATRALVPATCVAFVIEGRLGRRGRDYARPPLVAPTPARSGSGPRLPDPGGILEGIGGGLAERLGGRRGADVARTALRGFTEYVQQLNRQFTPEQEYYLGRAVAAHAIARYGVDPSARRRHYVRLVGDAVVRLTERLPANLGGYHFEVLDSDEVNGVSGPGGFVLLTRGAVEACRTEDELAALLCHELAHVSKKHGEKTLREGRSFQTFITGLSRTGAAAAGANDDRIARAMVNFFSQVVGEMSRTAVEHGYGRSAEFDADLEATYLLFDVFYDHAAMRNVLRTMAGHSRHPAGSATHAPPAARAAQLEAACARYGVFQGGAEVLARRQSRFETTLGRAPAAPR